MAQTASLKSVSVLNSEAQGDDAVVLTAAFDDGTGPHTMKLLMQKIGNDWKFSGHAQ